MVKLPRRLWEWEEVWRLGLLCSIAVLVMCSVKRQLWVVWSSYIMEVWGDTLWLIQLCVWCGLWHEQRAELKTSLTRTNKLSPWQLLTILHWSWQTSMCYLPSSHSYSKPCLYPALPYFSHMYTSMYEVNDSRHECSYGPNHTNTHMYTYTNVFTRLEKSSIPIACQRDYM